MSRVFENTGHFSFCLQGVGFELGRGRETVVSRGGIIQTEGFESAAERAVSVPSRRTPILTVLRIVVLLGGQKSQPYVRRGQMIGTSVALCIREMARGEVNPEHVEKIISGTACDRPECWDQVVRVYRLKYWVGVEDEAEALLRKFIKENRIEQPRLTHGRMPNRKAKLWVNSEEGIVWC
ncbi:MAG: hypothetical protein A2408_01115 [Candidatus Yonathbacteria bacterium RIFOXYC1_FULL_52_10]|nr:MAG: hypothetical protein A2408_01115 [Candidatus Yonathbacteria bacterium RIFOXYC1_FULL_52_10]